MFWQIIATIFLPTGLYAFKRINKLRSGVLIYLGVFGLLVLFGITIVFSLIMTNGQTSYNSAGELLADLWWVTLGWQLISIITPMVCIAYWSKAWNENLIKLQV